MTPTEIIDDLLGVYGDPIARQALLDARRRMEKAADAALAENCARAASAYRENTKDDGHA